MGPLLMKGWREAPAIGIVLVTAFYASMILSNGGVILMFGAIRRLGPKVNKITDAVIENMMSWNHSGFHVHIGERILPDDEEGLENLARYIIRACFSQEWMIYIPVAESADGVAKVIYTSKDGRTRKTFDALDWLAHLVTHVPGRYESRLWAGFATMATTATNQGGCARRQKRMMTSQLS